MSNNYPELGVRYTNYPTKTKLNYLVNNAINLEYAGIKQA